MNFSTCKLYRCCYNQMTKINELRQCTTVITSTTNVTTLWERRHSQEWQTRLETSRQKERTSRCCAYIGWTMYCRISSIRKPVALTNYSLTWQKKNIWKPVLEGNLFNVFIFTQMKICPPFQPQIPSFITFFPSTTEVFHPIYLCILMLWCLACFHIWY